MKRILYKHWDGSADVCMYVNQTSHADQPNKNIRLFSRCIPFMLFIYLTNNISASLSLFALFWCLSFQLTFFSFVVVVVFAWICDFLASACQRIEVYISRAIWHKKKISRMTYNGWNEIQVSRETLCFSSSSVVLLPPSIAWFACKLRLNSSGVFGSGIGSL